MKQKLIRAYMQTAKIFAELSHARRLHVGAIVVKDDRSNINIPFVKMANKVIAKTVMRKGDFQTNSPTIVNEITQGLYAGNLKINGKPVEIEVELLGADNKTKEFLTKVIHIDKEYQNKFPIGSTFKIPSRIFRLPGEVGTKSNHRHLKNP